MTNQEKYKKFCEGKNIPLFIQAWWLDITCEQKWEVAIIEKNKEVIAAWPYLLGKRSIFSSIGIPPLSKYSGPLIQYPEGQKLVSKIAFEKEILSELEAQLPNADYINLNLEPAFQNWIALSWKGYKSNSNCTYRIKDTSDLDNCFNGFKESVRRAIRKAQKSYTIEEGKDVDQLYQLNKSIFLNQGMAVPFSKPLLSALVKSTLERSCSKIFFAKDENGQIVASIFLVWDNNHVYYLLGGLAPEHKSSGVASLLMWYGIQFANSLNLAFDFEGSMIQSIEKYIQSFGGEQIYYQSLEKYNSKVLQILDSIRS